MYRKTMIGCVCVLIAMSGCTRNKIQQNTVVNLNDVPPTQNESAHANYGNPITTEEFENAVRSTLMDPYSAHVFCTKPEKGWWASGSEGIGQERHYGYSVICSVNAKNGFGAYTGEKRERYVKWITDGREVVTELGLLWHSLK